MKLAYHMIVERFHKHQNPTSVVKLDDLISYSNISDGDRVLDIGCGKAWLLRRMAKRFSIEGFGVDIRQVFIDEANEAITREPPKGKLTLHCQPAVEFQIEKHCFDMAMCIGASFAVGSFEQMLDYLRPAVKTGGILAFGDIYAKTEPMPAQSAKHFAGGAVRSLFDTAELLNKNGLSLISMIDSSLGDWDSYENLHWVAADTWLKENPAHPERDEFKALHEKFRHDHLKYDRESLGWAMFVCRVES